MTKKNHHRVAELPNTGYFTELIAHLGRNVLFIDTGAIIEYFDKGDARFKSFIDSENHDRLVTSEFVIGETVRRLVKSKSSVMSFAGPRGERAHFLAEYFVRTWLTDKNVYIIHTPAEVFKEELEVFCGNQIEDCDLIDIISTRVVRGLGQDRILAKDQHFLRLGLMRLPS